jgi:hypothetical protein
MKEKDPIIAGRPLSSWAADLRAGGATAEQAKRHLATLRNTS